MAVTHLAKGRAGEGPPGSGGRVPRMQMQPHAIDISEPGPPLEKVFDSITS